jgi:allantoin racemase
VTIPRQPRVLFLTPFHFGSPEKSVLFDELLGSHLSGRDVTTIARHVPEFDGPESDYESLQRDAIVQAVAPANAVDIDAIVVGCHYDPAVSEARAAAIVPVIAPLELVAGLARQLGPTFAVITDVEEAEGIIGGLLSTYGQDDACVSVRSIGWDGDRILEDTLGAARAVDAIVADLLVGCEVSAIVIGCTIVSAAYERHRHALPDRGVVVLDSNGLAVRVAAALSHGTRQST